MIQKNVTKSPFGVNVKFSGDITKESVSNMVESCSNGSCGCDCDPKLFEKIEGMEVSGEDGNVTIGLKGAIEVEEIQSAVEGCEL